MSPNDAQSTLDDIRRLQDRTRDELVGHNFSLPYALLMALGLFIGFASTDLPRPWNDVACLLGFGLYVGVTILQQVRQCRSSVRPRSLWVPTRLELVFYVGWAVSILLVFAAARTATWALDLPAQGTVAAAVVALAFVAATPLARRIVKAIMRQDSGRY
ncbi:hypothetical protein [Acrocarpospora sp. B8E8]|uniref:hypothetical protein n=1 Tax=Acrocarpospora sp. B8E8 TaxID=3153572 RepID=UPI00325D7056